MKKINFKKLYAENFLCFGNKGIEVDFSKFNNIVLIRGKNLDVTESSKSQDKIASNGVGKSSIPAILVYGMYGKTIRKPNKIGHKDVINNETGKKLKVEVYWDDYKLQRTRKPDALRLWKSSNNQWDDSTEITLGGMPATQKMVEDIIGMSYETFINVAIFTDDNTSSFLECDASEKRQIVENLLSLEKYRSYHENAKKILKNHKDCIKNLEKEIQFVEKQLSDEQLNQARLEKSKKDWNDKNIEEIKKYIEAIRILDQEKSKVVGEDAELKKYEQVLENISILEKEIVDIDDNIATLEKNETQISELKTKLKSQIDDYSKKCDSLKSDYQSLLSEIKIIESNVSKIENLEDGVKCTHCLQTVDKSSHDIVLSNYKNELAGKYEISNSKKEIYVAEKEKLDKLKTTEKSADEKIALLQSNIKKQNFEKSTKSKTLNDLLKIKKPEPNAKLKVIEEKINLLKNQLDTKVVASKQPSPYDNLIEVSESEIKTINENKDNKDVYYKELNEKTKYYEYWISAFGDSGIRKYVIDEIIPALNSNINYWMQFLIENKITLKFNNEFEETIEKYPTDNNKYVYECMSNGQRRRINLALSQAFAHVMSLNSGKTPNIVFLDEVTSNVDPQGVAGIYNMICELNKEKQVFITTHDHDLIEFLNGCDTLDLVMQKGMTQLEKS